MGMTYETFIKQFEENTKNMSSVDVITELEEMGLEFDANSVETPVVGEDYDDINNSAKTENDLLYVIIDNLIKARHASELYQQLLEGQITEQEYEVEIDSNNSKYVIDMGSKYNDFELGNINITTNKIIKNHPGYNREDAIAELFGSFEIQQ